MPHKQADTSQTQTANSLQRTNCYAWSAWTTANWVEFISQARKAGDVQKFCLKHGISRNAYYTRFKKLLPDHPEWLQKRRQKLRAKQLPFLKSIPALPTPKVGVEVLPELWQTEKHLYKPFKPGPNEPTIEVLRQLLLNLPGVDNCSDLATGKAILRAELDGKHAAALGSDFIPALCLDYFPSDTESWFRSLRPGNSQAKF